MSRARLLLPTLAIATALALSGCGGGGDTPADAAAPTTEFTPPPAPAPGVTCEDEAADGTAVHFGPEEKLGGITFGSGTKAVVLLHQADGSLCQWVPYAKELAESGYLALAFDKPKGFSSGNAAPGNAAAVVAAVTYLRGKGATDVTLIGASMGGTAVLAAAVQATPPVNGVIALSPPTYYDGTDALALVPKLAVPVLYAASDKDAQFGDNVRKFDAATPPGVDRKLLVLDGGDHGVDLVDEKNGSEAKKVRDAINDFLAAHMPV